MPNTSLFWFTYIFRSLRRSGRRAVFAGICVVVGVAGVVALETAALTVRNALTTNVRAANGGDLSISTDTAPLSAVDLAVFQRLQRQGRISAWTAVSTVHATAVGSGGRLVPFSVDIVRVPPYPLGGQPTFTSPSNGDVGRLMRSHGDVLVSTVLAQELGVGVGSKLQVSGIGAPGLHVTVRGVLAETNLQHSAAMTAEARDAAFLSGGRPRYTAVYANVAGSPATVASYLRNQFPTATVQTVAEALQAQQQEVHDFQQFLTMVGLLALLIAGVGILNAMQSILARRRLEIAMLKAMGFRQSALYVLFGGEALMIGLMGGMVGTLLGVAVSKIITDALARAQAIQVQYIVDAGTILAGVALGVGATLVFSIMPIVRAAALRPLEILREGTPVPASEWVRTPSLLILMFGLFTVLTSVSVGDAVLAAEFVIGAGIGATVLAGIFALVVSWIGRLGPPASFPIGMGILIALVLVTIVAAMRVPAIAAIVAFGTLLFAATVLLSRQRLLTLLIAARSLSRRKARTSVMLVAFLAGVLAMTVTLTVALALQGQISAALASNGADNLVAVGGANDGGRILSAARGLTGIHNHTVMTTVATEPVSINGRSVVSVLGPLPAVSNSDEGSDRIRPVSGVTGWAISQGSGPSNIRILEGRPLGSADVGSNHVLVRDELLGPPFNLTVGDTLRLRETGTGVVKAVKIVGFYSRSRRGRRFSGFFSPPVYGDQKLALALGGSDAQTIVTFAADQSALARDAATLQRSLPGALVIDVGDLTAIVDTILDELLHLLAVITALVLGAGVAVVANGVALAMLERRREIALFKAIGFGPGSVQGFVLVENALVGTLAGAASVLATAIALGLLSHYALQQAIGFDPLLAVVVLVIAAALAVVTAYLAARAPIRVRPLEALRNE